MIGCKLVCVGVLIATYSGAVTTGGDDNLAESNPQPVLVPFFPPLGNLDLWGEFSLYWPLAGLCRLDEPADQNGPAPCSPDEQGRIDELLRAWELRSLSIERYRCTFRRWEYDPVFGPRETFRTYSEGVIKYAAPSKGMFRVDRTLEYTPPATPGGRPDFVPRQVGLEHWHCDGRWLYQHDPKNRQIIQHELPPEKRTPSAETAGVPFLIGAPLEIIRQRYWLRLLPVPAGVEDQYWLEATPKTARDAAKFQKLRVVIDQADFLPKGLVVFDRNFDAVRNPARTVFTFQNREVNSDDAEGAFDREFGEPKPPDGWKKAVESLPPVAHEHPGFRAGTAAVDISPTVFPMQLRSGPSRYVHDPLHVRAIAFENGQGRAVIAVVDANATLAHAEPDRTENVIVQAIRIGDQAIVSMPFEVLVEIGLEIKEKSPFPRTFLIELANGSYGYLPPPHQHELGGYETWIGTSKFEKDSSVILTRDLLEMLEELKTQ